MPIIGYEISNAKAVYDQQKGWRRAWWADEENIIALNTFLKKLDLSSNDPISLKEELELVTILLAKNLEDNSASADVFKSIFTILYNNSSSIKTKDNPKFFIDGLRHLFTAGMLDEENYNLLRIAPEQALVVARILEITNKKFSLDNHINSLNFSTLETKIAVLKKLDSLNLLDLETFLLIDRCFNFKQIKKALKILNTSSFTLTTISEFLDNSSSLADSSTPALDSQVSTTNNESVEILFGIICRLDEVYGDFLQKENIVPLLAKASLSKKLSSLIEKMLLKKILRDNLTIVLEHLEIIEDTSVFWENIELLVKNQLLTPEYLALLIKQQRHEKRLNQVLQKLHEHQAFSSKNVEIALQKIETINNPFLMDILLSFIKLFAINNWLSGEFFEYIFDNISEIAFSKSYCERLAKLNLQNDFKIAILKSLLSPENKKFYQSRHPVTDKDTIQLNHFSSLVKACERLQQEDLLTFENMQLIIANRGIAWQQTLILVNTKTIKEYAKNIKPQLLITEQQLDCEPEFAEDLNQALDIIKSLKPRLIALILPILIENKCYALNIALLVNKLDSLKAFTNNDVTLFKAIKAAPHDCQLFIEILDLAAKPGLTIKPLRLASIIYRPDIDRKAFKDVLVLLIANKQDIEKNLNWIDENSGYLPKLKIALQQAQPFNKESLEEIKRTLPLLKISTLKLKPSGQTNRHRIFAQDYPSTPRTRTKVEDPGRLTQPIIG